ncbi:1,4-alpha-glucan branching protein GlgB [Clostridium intestinale]|uniref:1,4-alpha-glucan branching enzyme GlgB n=2 Tax=Clostridium intestinale TaxID=36845 RepID=A0A7D6VVN3_9CLOT|nr:1,4-alpha-glucan branching protein GlgB [Clostridium intestinale]QLY82257.1 1,4-alpha-glucan branching protein GlgB [Clostridium intestinale]
MVELKDRIEDKKTEIIDIKNISDYDTYLFHNGSHYNAYKFMGAHLITEKRKRGVRFTTWAPKAKAINIVGDFNNWEVLEEYSLERITKSGLWSAFIPGMKEGQVYKYAITTEQNKIILKSDPYSIYSELRPNTASIITRDLKYRWKDRKWINSRNKTDIYKSPVNIYELHLGSWKTDENGEFLSYLELAKNLPEYVKNMGYTHVELMPIMEHPLDDSWGYQVVGYYSVTSRYGTRDEFKELINALHNEGIGVILDWVPGHFCKDNHGLYKYDGSVTYEYEELSKQENKGWGAANFDLGRPEVKSFLISNALYWLREFHIDGLRVDAVANILYLDYGREKGEWSPNKYGGRENLEAAEFIKELNTAVFKEFSNILMIAEESTTWPMVTKPVEMGGLGFNFKWNMGWMNDVLKYVEIDPIYRKFHHNLINFAMMYHYTENFILPISHDEVVHGKKSLIDKMWGDYWNKFSGLRAFLGFMMTHPGKKTTFMGNEFAQFIEWRSYEQLEWKLIDEFPRHKQTQEFYKDLNNLYKTEKALWQLDYEPNGFKWIDADNKDQSIFIYCRMGEDKKDTLIVICNFTPKVYYDFKVGVPYLGEYYELFNSDASSYGGSGQVMDEVITAISQGWHKEKYSLKIKVPPMATLILKPQKIEEGILEDELVESK